MATSTVEDYLKRLYLEQRALGMREAVPTGRLAAVMGVTPGTATSMVKALADSGLVEYTARAGVGLTSQGQQLALHVLRRHRLVELFLVKALGLDWADVHEEAEALEHAVSDRVIERIDAVLGFPKVDPHGDPIPSEKGHVDETHHISLADCQLLIPHQVTRVLDQDPAFLRFAGKCGLTPGATVSVASRETQGQSVQVQVKGSPPAALGWQAAEKILVQGVGQRVANLRPAKTHRQRG